MEGINPTEEAATQVWTLPGWFRYNARHERRPTAERIVAKQLPGGGWRNPHSRSNDKRVSNHLHVCHHRRILTVRILLCLLSAPTY